MVFCNLKVLLAQRGISISKMSSATNISRTTLTALCSNKSGGIQFDTLNTICSYLNVAASELILYSPYEFKLQRNSDYLEIHITNLLNRANFRVVFSICPEPLIVNFEHLTGEENYDNDVAFDEYNYDKLNLLKDENDKLFRRFQSIIPTLPKCYISYLNEEIMYLLSDIFNDANSDFFSVETNFY